VIAAASVLRSWTGWIRTADRTAYTAHLERTGLPGYRGTEGNVGATVLMRDLGDGRTEVRTLSLWVSFDALAAFAGDDIETAVFYPEDDRFLIEREYTVSHFDIVSTVS